MSFALPILKTGFGNPQQRPLALAMFRRALAVFMITASVLTPFRQASEAHSGRNRALRSRPIPDHFPVARPPAASSPSISLSVPPQVPIGATVNFSVSFDNGDPVDVGYGPILDVILDTTGADAEAAGGPFDGLGTSSITASYLGNPFTTGGSNPTMWILTFNGAGQATHPLIRDNLRKLHHGQRYNRRHAGRAAPAVRQLCTCPTTGNSQSQRQHEHLCRSGRTAVDPGTWSL